MCVHWAVRTGGRPPLELRNFEERAKAAVEGALGVSDGQNLWSRYMVARRTVLHEVLPGIPVAEPGLTDHMEHHIANVLDNIDKLVGPQAFADGTISAGDGYALCLSAL